MTGPLRRAALLVAVEGVALVVLGVGYAVAGFVGRPEDRTATVLAGLLATVVGLLLLPLARALDRARGWARSPVVVLQLLELPVGYGLAQGGVWVGAVPVLALAVGTLAQLAAPEARSAFSTPERDPR